jgi:hypothetical protein
VTPANAGNQLTNKNVKFSGICAGFSSNLLVLFNHNPQNTYSTALLELITGVNRH